MEVGNVVGKAGRILKFDMIECLGQSRGCIDSGRTMDRGTTRPCLAGPKMSDLTGIHI